MSLRDSACHPCLAHAEDGERVLERRADGRPQLLLGQARQAHLLQGVRDGPGDAVVRIGQRAAEVEVDEQLRG
jgi:hypothetical protein